MYLCLLWRASRVRHCSPPRVSPSPLSPRSSRQITGQPGPPGAQSPAHRRPHYGLHRPEYKVVLQLVQDVVRDPPGPEEHPPKLPPQLARLLLIVAGPTHSIPHPLGLVSRRGRSPHRQPHSRQPCHVHPAIVAVVLHADAKVLHLVPLVRLAHGLALRSGGGSPQRVEQVHPPAPRVNQHHAPVHIAAFVERQHMRRPPIPRVSQRRHQPTRGTEAAHGLPP
mmetsp:Transcript_11352/g.23702  ORF Transcript_11352/g.23702 Transcript_11352/m.23702 type:complete len:223 (+) Transcript_11352:211-879(+)